MTQIPIKTGLPLVLVDFDQTLTVNDTIAVLGQFGLDHHPELNFNWSFFADSFMKEYYAHKATLPPCNDWTCFLDQLNSFKPIEAASLARVNKHQVFKDLTQQQLFQGGQDRSQKELQPGCIDALRPYIPQIRVVSLNWSKDWVLGFLNQLQLNKNQIFSNDIVFNEDGVSPKGEIIPRILTCGDKTQVIQDCIVQKEQKKFIYIGDSIGDVEALVQANIGIVIGKNKSLLEALNKFGYSVQEDITKPSQIYRVDDWNQIKNIFDMYYTHL